MPDIAMCAGDNCEIRLTCYRFTATANQIQSYIRPSQQGLGCHYFWPNDEPKDGKPNAK